MRLGKPGLASAFPAAFGGPGPAATFRRTAPLPSWPRGREETHAVRVRSCALAMRTPHQISRRANALNTPHTSPLTARGSLSKRRHASKGVKAEKRGVGAKFSSRKKKVRATLFFCSSFFSKAPRPAATPFKMAQYRTSPHFLKNDDPASLLVSDDKEALAATKGETEAGQRNLWRPGGSNGCGCLRVRVMIVVCVREGLERGRESRRTVTRGLPRIAHRPTVGSRPRFPARARHRPSAGRSPANPPSLPPPHSLCSRHHHRPRLPRRRDSLRPPPSGRDRGTLRPHLGPPLLPPRLPAQPGGRHGGHAPPVRRHAGHVWA